MIGQDHAKKVLSVAVYNHYKRIFHNAPVSNNSGANRKQEAVPQSLNSRGNDWALTSVGDTFLWVVCFFTAEISPHVVFCLLFYVLLGCVYVCMCVWYKWFCHLSTSNCIKFSVFFDIHCKVFRPSTRLYGELKTVAQLSVIMLPCKSSPWVVVVVAQLDLCWSFTITATATSKLYCCLSNWPMFS